MSDQTQSKRKTFWNPFQSIQGEKEATDAANAGVVVAGFLALSYLVQAAFVYYTGKDTFGHSDGLVTFLADVSGILLAVYLGWMIRATQSLGAAIFTALWYAFELALKAMAIVEGLHKTNPGFIVMFAALFVAAILTVRGSWKLRQLRLSPSEQRE